MAAPTRALRDAIRHAVEPSDAPGSGVVTREKKKGGPWAQCCSQQGNLSSSPIRAKMWPGMGRPRFRSARRWIPGMPYQPGLGGEQFLQIDGNAISTIHRGSEGLFVLYRASLVAIVGVARHPTTATAHHAQHLEVVHAIAEGHGLGHLQARAAPARRARHYPLSAHRHASPRGSQAGEGDVESITILLVEVRLYLQQLVVVADVEHLVDPRQSPGGWRSARR